MPDATASLFSPITLGDLTLPNRIFMAPLTRSRAAIHRLPNDLMAEYYRQRASAGLILSEATSVSPMGIGYPDTPGIWCDEQQDAWQRVTSAVHQAGGHIFLQLWHVGRISHPLYLEGRRPVAPSAVAAKGHVSHFRPKRPFVTPRALTRREIADVVQDYANATRRARKAGFDGVEIHAANGYLIDQFLQPSSNHRTDSYGGSISNRCRFLLEVTETVCSTWSPARVGVHLAPRGDDDPADPTGLHLFTHACRELGHRGIAFICAREPRAEDWLGPRLRAAFGGPYVANQEFTPASAATCLANAEADAIAFGRHFISNPDLHDRIQQGAPLNDPRPESFYSQGPRGYTDYPTLQTGRTP